MGGFIDGWRCHCQRAGNDGGKGGPSGTGGGRGGFRWYGDWVSDQLSVGWTMSIRQLDPGSAWNEAERRAIPLGFVGFFLGGVIGVFGLDPGIREPFLAGICGAVGLFLADIAFLVGFYRKKLGLAVIATLLI